jgi:hypothetical protein
MKRRLGWRHGRWHGPLHSDGRPGKPHSRIREALPHHSKGRAPTRAAPCRAARFRRAAPCREARFRRAAPCRLPARARGCGFPHPPSVRVSPSRLHSEEQNGFAAAVRVSPSQLHSEEQNGFAAAVRVRPSQLHSEEQNGFAAAVRVRPSRPRPAASTAHWHGQPATSSDGLEDGGRMAGAARPAARTRVMLDTATNAFPGSLLRC